MIVRGLSFRDEDDAYDYFRQREIDEVDEVTFDEERHEYRIEGRLVPSVTQIIKPVQRELGGSPDTLDWKRQIGKALDSAITIHERGEEIDPDSLDEAVAPFFSAWLKFKAETGFRALLNQPLVYSRKLRFAGTADLLGTRLPPWDRDNALAPQNPDELIDTKCVWTMDPATAIQTAGYALAALESLGIRVKTRGGLQLLRDGSYRYHPYTSAMDENVFKALLSIHAWRSLHA